MLETFREEREGCVYRRRRTFLLLNTLIKYTLLLDQKDRSYSGVRNQKSVRAKKHMINSSNSSGSTSVLAPHSKRVHTVW